MEKRKRQLSDKLKENIKRRKEAEKNKQKLKNSSINVSKGQIAENKPSKESDLNK